MAELVSKAYADALFSVAVEDNTIASMQSELDFIVSSFKEYPQFYEIVKMPNINKADKKAVLAETFGDKVSVEMLNFFKTLVDKNRIVDIDGIKAEFDARVDDYNKVLNVTVESVVSLSEEQIQALTQKLKDKTGKEIVLTSQVNPSLLGGMVVKMGEQVIDGSVKYKLESMLEGLTQIIV